MLNRISRRDHLKGLALGPGAVVLSPIVRQLQAHAAGAGEAMPRRVVFYLEGNGIEPIHFQPNGIERGKQGSAPKLIDQPLTGHELPEQIAALTPFKDRMTIIQGLSGRVAVTGHSCRYGALGAYRGHGEPMGPTIDAAMAEALPAAVFPHVALGVTGRDTDSIVYSITAAGRNKPLPVQCNPALAHKALFGSVAAGSGRQQFDLRSNMLDHMADDVRAVRGAFGGPERERLDTYLQAFESLRSRQDKVGAMEARLQKNLPPVTDQYHSDVNMDRFAAHCDLAAAAMIGGLTNTILLASQCGDYFGGPIQGLGITISKHSIGHGGGQPGMTCNQLVTKIRKYHVDLLTKFVKRLADVPEGNGTMLDNTLIVYMSDSAESHHATCREWPIMLIGNLGGRLKAGNRFLQMPSYGNKGHRTIGNLYQSFLHAAGKPVKSFGVEDTGLRDLDQTGPLAELLA